MTLSTTDTELDIALVLDRWEPKRGGLEAYANSLCMELARRGHRVVIVTGTASGRVVVDDDVARHVTVESVRGQGVRFYEEADELLHRLEREGTLGVAFRHPGPASVFLPLGGLLVSSLAARRRSENALIRPLRALARRMSSRTRTYLEREARFFRDGTSAPRLCLCNSPLVAADVASRHPSFAGKLDVVGLPVDMVRFHPPDDARRAEARSSLGLGDGPAILFVGHDEKRKGLSAAKAVLQRVRARRVDAALVLAGHGTERFHDEARGVRALGFVDDMLSVYHACDVLLAPSLEDNLSSCALEALSTGLPVVTTRCNGIAAWLAPEDVPDASRLARVVQDPTSIHDLDAATLAMLGRSALCMELRRARREVIGRCADHHHFDLVEQRLAEFEAITSAVRAS
ncbi:MAG: glycosyltransferase family 4 protein [Planctomycetes bacterium]|nr:glycosyltransferase family 4 protein [Planctomycetota bacterium]MCB9919890.1 glycosyltransferase family 4 protein [Planctomycetota bacterium]